MYTVSEILKAARQTLESRFSDVSVEAEVSDLRRSPGGHYYFVLKERDSQLPSVLFARDAQRFTFDLKEGLKVQARGRITLFENRGRFQFVVTSATPAGEGALALAFERLKRQLATEGLFDPQHKKELPFLPRRIGIVTSPQGAVIRDFLRVVHRRFPVAVLLCPALVQGPEAPGQIATGIQRLAAIDDVDVIVIARGGGALEDLWGFNDEQLARAIFASPTPHYFGGRPRNRFHDRGLCGGFARANPISGGRKGRARGQGTGTSPCDPKSPTRQRDAQLPPEPTTAHDEKPWFAYRSTSPVQSETTAT